MMGGVEKVKFFGRGGGGESSSLLETTSLGGVKLLISASTICWAVLLVVLLVVSSVESVPTANFNAGGGGGGEKEVVLQGRSLFWPSSLEMNGNEYHHQKRTAQQPTQLCGYRLLEAVRGLCRGNYVGYNRRSDPDMEDERMISDQPAVVETDLTSQSHRHRHQQLYNRQRQHPRYRRNIIDECCMKPCSVNEMLRYCGR